MRQTPISKLLVAASLLVLSGCSTTPTLPTASPLASSPLQAQAAAPTAEYIRANALRLGAAGQMPDAAFRTLSPYRAILVGEIHGTAETPRLALEISKLLMRRGQGVVLGLEVPRSAQPLMDRFRKSGDAALLRQIPFFKREPNAQDGRSSQAVANLVIAAQALGLELKCLDSDGAATAPGRDAEMAANLSRAIAQAGGKTVVMLTGNAHASQVVGAPWDPKFRPMAYELTQLAEGAVSADQICSIKVRNQNGTAWACLDGDCRAHQFPLDSSAYTQALSWESYFLKEPGRFEGFNATIYWRTMSASEPFVRAGR